MTISTCRSTETSFSWSSSSPCFNSQCVDKRIENIFLDKGDSHGLKFAQMLELGRVVVVWFERASVSVGVMAHGNACIYQVCSQVSRRSRAEPRILVKASCLFKF
ncbi:hypothetical protein SLEP1_g36057 [Rubroshorea leprosula]|uniref:Uncharacterized protein n=1 Tax=Rubroshorea leprosula TaxID=152421 RepID=A0AAV5KQX1_9ROSI|nr:hypothetical protein SLEP1_g36057 [Rubroshorea leprosula]